MSLDASIDPAQYSSPSELDNNPRFRVLPAFHSRFLPSDRNVFVYLPEAYRTQPRRRFPVFYLHDGQNLFDGRTSYVAGRTWRAHTTADRLTAEGRIEPLILVGIANTGLARMAEYTPTPDRRHAGGQGDLYGQLLVQDLKPLIDARFRTLPDPPNTALGGSSLGGLISLYLGLKYPEIFGKLAVMSPSVWWDSRRILDFVNSVTRPPLNARAHITPAHPRIWLDMGLAEGLRHVRDTDLLHRRLTLRGWHESPGPTQDLRYLRIPNAQHDESAWADRFDQVLQFLFPANA